MAARMREKYVAEVTPKLTERFHYTNPMEVPKLEKIVLNVGLGQAATNAKLMDGCAADLAIIAGQKPVVRKAKKAISNFKLRAGMPVGCSVTLRGERMYEFFDRLVSTAIPRLRDFRGVPTRSFDGHGNYTLGLTEHTIFPEIDYDKVEAVRGMNITFVTTARKDEEAMELLKLMGMPFRK